MSNRLKFIIFIGLLAFASLKYSSYARNSITDITKSFVGGYLHLKQYVNDNIETHFEQKKQIEELKKQNEELRRSSLLLTTFAGKLNRILENNNKETYKPKLQLIEALSYEQISNYNRVWIKMDDFNSSRIYGIVFQGNTAGIVISKNDRPLGLLQGDKKCVFSVSIGKKRLPGVATGNGEFIYVKFIPLWMNPKIGQKVVTSGLDKIFPRGIPVGEVVKIRKEESYQTAIVKPNAIVNTPAFFHIIQ